MAAHTPHPAPSLPLLPLLLLPLLLLLVPIAHAQEGVLVGALSELQHDVSGTLYALDSRTLRLDDFTYDGLGPAGVFWVNTGDAPASAGGRIIHTRSTCALSSRLPAFAGESVILELPADLSLADIRYFSIWCSAVAANFGGVALPAALSDQVPPNTAPECADAPGGAMAAAFAVRDGWNCEALAPFLQLRWQISGESLNVELVARLPEDRYMGFGPSGADDRLEMVGADAVIAYRTADAYSAVDYHLESRDQCSSGQGVCADTELVSAPASANDVTDVRGNRTDDGVVRIQYTRPLAASDEIDRPILTEGDTFVLWAVGPVANDLPLFHTGAVNYPNTNLAFEFGRVPNNACPRALSGGDASVVPGFVRPTLSDVPNITARIGPSAGARGYEGITGGVGWGIAWYLSETNTTGEDILIPAVGVVRGKTYTFSVYGGRSVDGVTNVHPFYLTNSSTGGYADRTPAERAAERVYAGIRVDASDADGGVLNFTATAAGALCMFSSEVNDTTNIETWDEYRESLDTSCTENDTISANKGTLTWTVANDTPDELYYQCVTHQFLGYRIAVFDDEVDEARLATLSSGADLGDGDGEETKCEVTFKGETETFPSCVIDGKLGAVDVFFRVTDGVVDTIFRAERPDGGYLGFGWGYTNMVGSNVVIAFQDQNGTAVASNYLMTAQSSSGVQPAAANISGVEADLTDDGFIMGRFQRPLLSTNVEGALPNLTMEQNDFIWAIGAQPSSETSLSQHTRSDRGTGKINFADANQSTSSAGSRDPYFSAHGFFMGVSWTLLAPYAVVAMRFFKRYNPVTFQVHRAVNTTVALFTVLGFFLAIFRASRTESAHRGIGYALTILVIGQALGGALRPHKDTAARQPWYYAHMILGTVAMVLGFTNTVIGINILEVRRVWLPLAVIAYVSAIATYVVLSFLPRQFPVVETDKGDQGGGTGAGVEQEEAVPIAEEMI